MFCGMCCCTAIDINIVKYRYENKENPNLSSLYPAIAELFPITSLRCLYPMLSFHYFPLIIIPYLNHAHAWVFSCSSISRNTFFLVIHFLYGVCSLHILRDNYYSSMGQCLVKICPLSCTLFPSVSLCSTAYFFPSHGSICISSKIKAQAFLWCLSPVSILIKSWDCKDNPGHILISGAGYDFKSLWTVLLLTYQSNFKITFGSPMYLKLRCRRGWFWNFSAWVL